MATKGWRFLAGMTILLLTVAVSACIPAEIREGERLYMHHCSTCHGPGGWGTELGPPLHPERRGEIIQQVRNPRGRMPPLPPSALSDEELRKIANYLIYLHYELSGHGH
ncbi:MAG: cytochrome c [Dehalococcoidia bacterium]